MWPFKKKEDPHASHGEQSQPSSQPSSGRAMRVGKWDVEEKVLGEGGYGKVTRAFDRTVTPPVTAACKWIDTRRMKKTAIEREVRVNQKLKHKNIAACYDYIFIDPTAFVLFEMCGGGELFERVISAGKMQEDVARKLFVELCNGVAHCHEKGIVHRDLKLENVMLSSDGSVKIIDFGLAAEYEPNGHGGFNMSTLYETCGSKSYAAPEVLSGKGYSGFGADVWSCGICLFAMLAGFFPLDEATSRDWRYQRGVKAVAQGASLVHTIYGFYQRQCPLSPEAVALLDGMLAMDPTRRLTLTTVLHSPWVTGRKLPAAAVRGGGAGAATAPYVSADFDIEGRGPTYRSVQAATSASGTEVSGTDSFGEECADAEWGRGGCAQPPPNGAQAAGAGAGAALGGGPPSALEPAAQPQPQPQPQPAEAQHELPAGGWVAAPMSFCGPSSEEIAAAAAAEEALIDEGHEHPPHHHSAHPAHPAHGSHGGAHAFGPGTAAAMAGYSGGGYGGGYSSDTMMIVDDDEGPVYRAFGASLAAALPSSGERGDGAATPSAWVPPGLERQRAFEAWPVPEEEGS